MCIENIMAVAIMFCISLTAILSLISEMIKDKKLEEVKEENKELRDKNEFLSKSLQRLDSKLSIYRLKEEKGTKE